MRHWLLLATMLISLPKFAYSQSPFTQDGINTNSTTFILHDQPLNHAAFGWGSEWTSETVSTYGNKSVISLGLVAEVSRTYPMALAEPIANGPLTIHTTNPRYFTDGTRKAIYLTGSHTWAQITDAFDFSAYLDFLESYHHNFIRLWSADYNIGTLPAPYLRTGPGNALDGGPKVNLDQFNQAYFDRIRANVIAALDRGMYVAINLYPLDSVRRVEDWNASVFHAGNNVQGLNGDTDGNGHGTEAFDLSIPQITAYHEAFARKIIDTVNDLDNVLYEVGNEGDWTSINFQYHIINFAKNYEQGLPKQHLMGMSAVYDWLAGSGSLNNTALSNSPADWIAPGGAPFRDNPPATGGQKVIIADVDHIWPSAPLRGWIWESFLRGYHPILMDWYTFGPPTRWTVAEQEATRKYMGYTLTYAEKMDLAAMTPRGDLSSTTYVLANPGSEYLIYQPTSMSSFTVNLQAGTYTYEWFNSSTGLIAETGNLTATSGNRSFTAPFSGESVLYLKFTIIPDTTPPVISGIGSPSTTHNGSAITWTTNEPADSQVEYGATLDYGSFTTLDSSLVTIHSQVLGNLTPETMYHYRVISRDSAGNLSVSGDTIFTTLSAPDTTAPVISQVSITAVTTSTAQIIWTTDEASDSSVEYGLTTAYGILLPVSTAMVSNHSRSLTGLAAGTLYHYRVRSRDVSGNLAVSQDQTFTTASLPPSITNLQSTNVKGTTATITWKTNKPATGLVEYGTTAAFGSMSTIDTNLTTTHSINLTGLARKTTYYYRVKSTSAGATATSPIKTLKTLVK